MWAFDEHRLGLRPVLRRQWAPKGQRPIAVGRHRYEWLYLHGVVHPGTGEVVWFICTTVDAELLSAVLAAFAAAVGAGEGKLIVLVLDDAGWHISGDLVVPKGIELAFLPSYTPELQPAEHLWPLADEAVANMLIPGQVGHRFRDEAGHRFRRDVGHPDLKSATRRVAVARSLDGSAGSCSSRTSDGWGSRCQPREYRCDAYERSCV